MNVATASALMLGGCDSDGESDSDAFPAVPSTTDNHPTDCHTGGCGPESATDGEPGSGTDTTDSGDTDSASTTTSGGDTGSTAGSGSGSSGGSDSGSDSGSGTGSTSSG